MVATSDFSGLVSSARALESAPPRLARASLDRCMAALPAQKVEAHGTGFRALGPNAMPDGFLGIFRHEALEFGLGLLMLEVGIPGPRKRSGEFRPRVRR